MSDQGDDRTVQRFFGLVLMAVGALIGGLSGLCTLAFVFTGVTGMFGRSGGTGGVGMIFLALFVGAFPIAIGVGLFVGGRALWRPRSKPSSRPARPISFTEPD